MPRVAAPLTSDPQVYSQSEQLMLAVLPCAQKSIVTSSAGFGSMPAVSEEGSSGSGRSPVHVDVGSLQHYKNRVGPELRLMRQAQGRNRYDVHLLPDRLPQKLSFACMLHAAQTLHHLFIQRVRSFVPAVDCGLCTAPCLSHAIRHASSLHCPATSNGTLPLLVLLCFRPERAEPDSCNCREYYTIDHLTRLKQFEAQTPYNEAKCSDYCKDYHVQPCRACTTCHFCRYASYHVTVAVTVHTIVTDFFSLTLVVSVVSCVCEGFVVTSACY